MNVNHNFELVTPLEIKVVNVKSLAYNSVATVESTDFSKQFFEVVKTCDLTDSERKRLWLWKPGRQASTRTAFGCVTNHLFV